ncbi:BON domain-containing protein [Phenylobacterium sp.]|uniref:BON domain-containing protein n=1 Tax=Phenylobacterium sp. TaxID=1871053 RepID=UPI0025FC1E01|nr:BON domain-containing protein [Phenylobacterium sp.]
MRREDMRDLEAERLRRLRDRDRDDFGQADYSNLYGYDPRTRSGYRAYDDVRPDPVYEAERPPRSADWDDERHRARRDGPSDRVLWAVIMERLNDERRLDLREVEVEVHDGEVTLNGTVRHKADKRRIEDVADIEGVRNVQNNLRPREANRRWTFL